MKVGTKIHNSNDLDLDTVISDGVGDTLNENQLMALLAISHTKIEHKLYELMLAETRNAQTKIGSFSVRHLMVQSGVHNYSSIRRARTGLVEKLSVEQQKFVSDSQTLTVIYVVYSPTEILARRQNAGMLLYPKELMDESSKFPNSLIVIERLIEKHSLSRREAHVAYQCAEGLTNAEIGKRLFIQEETVKFHLRNVFIKFGVKRRTELMANLFRQVPAPYNKLTEQG